MIRGDSFFVAGVSFNEPKICPNATWNENGIIFADSSVIGSNPQTFFMNTNNTAYAVNSQNGKIVIWVEGSTSPTGTVGTNSTSVYTLFVTPEADIYIDNWSHNGVDVWREGTANCVSTLYINGGCYSVFIDTNDALYCSLQNSHRVIKRSLNSSDLQLATVAGTGCPGYQASTLFTPSRHIHYHQLQFVRRRCWQSSNSTVPTGSSEWNNDGWQRSTGDYSASFSDGSDVGCRWIYVHLRLGELQNYWIRTLWISMRDWLYRCAGLSIQPVVEPLQHGL